MPRLYELTDDHRALLPAWRDQWIASAMSTAPTTPQEWDRIIDAVERLYRAAHLTPPPRARIVLVPSPMVGRFAAGFASAIWEARTRDATWAATDAATRDATRAATRDATDAATRDATDAATRAATRAATWAATRDSTDAATRDATWAATWAATRAATRDATRDATRAATWAATWAATRDATWAATDAATGVRESRWYTQSDGCVQAGHAILGTRQARGFALASQYSWDGGNQWAGYSAYLSFFRHVAGLDLDYTHWDAYETLARLSGPRFMHAEFCLVSMRPELLTVDAQRRPHADAGPFCRWRDGVSLYVWHGVYCPAWVLESPESITVADIHAEENAEVRRVMIERIGEDRFLAAGGGQHLHADDYGSLYRLADDTLAVRVVNGTVEPNGTRKVYWLYPHPELRPMQANGALGEPQPMTAHAAVASTYGLTAEQYAPAVRT